MAMRRGQLDEPLLQLNVQGDILTNRDFAQNIFVTGVTGSGKTSGPGRHILTALLKSGAGGIVLCAKPGEADQIRALCTQTGRLGSLIEWNGRNHGFNFLAHALAKLSADGVNSATEYLMRVIEMMRAASAMQGTNGDTFWLDSLRVLLRYSLHIVNLATGTLRIADIMAFVRAAPTSPDQLTDPAWQEGSFFFHCFMMASDRIDPETAVQMTTYWKTDFAKMDAKLRGNILAGFAILDRLNHGWLCEALSGATSVVPALCFHGAVIVLDMPRATMGDDGIIAQMIFKDAWQTEVLGRNALPPAHRERFVFCYADECQEFTTEGDAAFCAMSRSARSSTIYLTQSVPTLTAKLGGNNARDRALHLMGNFGLRFYCANSCSETNELAARTIGKSLQTRSGYSQNVGTSGQFGMNMGEGTSSGTSHNVGASSSSSGGGTSYGSTSSVGSSYGSNESWARSRGTGSNRGESWSQNEQVDYIIEPGQFGQILKTGGPANGNRVSAILYQAGRVFGASSGNALLVEFNQS